MNFDTFTMRDVQTFIAMLDTFEVNGVSDVRFVRQRLSEHLQNHILKIKKLDRTQHRATEKCPQCSYPMVKANTGDTHCIVLACRKCRYSKLVSTATGVPCCGDKK